MKSIEDIANLYNERLNQNLPDHKVCGWGSKESQHLRFKVLSEIGDLENCSILDVGCGLGEFRTYLKDQNIRLQSFQGIDISNNLVDEAQRRFKNDPIANFTVSSIQSYNGSKVDYVFCSGAMNLKMQDNWKMVADALTRSYAISNRGIAFNFLSSYVDFSHEKDFHYEPERMFKLAREISRFVTLRHDYPLYEFTIYLKK